MKTILFIPALAAGTILLTQAVRAQSGGGYSITSSTMDTGGGRSSGGGYTLHGTIGQPDANKFPSSGNSYAFFGGFWPAVVLQLNSIYQLAIVPEGAGVRLTWPAAARDEGYYLQTTANLDSGWFDVAGTAGVTTYLQPTLSGPLRFYRLIKP